MACFTDLPYADWSYEILRTIANAVPEGGGVLISRGCYSELNDSGKLYQFYINLAILAGVENPKTQNCFEQSTEATQWDLVNTVLEDYLTPPII